jgi:crotonobetainyl-CoA:carnitine CoA-transferase CaiB-like acyl-CoA transferase
LFARWARLMGEDHWLADPRFKDDISRGDNGAVVSERMSRWCAGHTSEEALNILGGAMIPAGPVLRPQQVLDDPHVQAMNFFQPIDYPGLPKPAPVTRAAIALGETPGAIERRAPILGEHTEAILGELGYDAAEIADLRAQGVV